MTFAVFFLAEYANMIFMAVLAVILFFGGWHSPFEGIAYLKKIIIIGNKGIQYQCRTPPFCAITISLRLTLPAIITTVTKAKPITIVRQIFIYSC
jgi:NADH-quinone oxidoreductase subunit H